MIVSEITNSASYASNPELLNTEVNKRVLWAVKNVLDRYGADYRVVPKGLAKTEFCRTGRLVHNFGTAGAFVEEFDAVIHVGFNGSNASIPTTPYRPDSLTLTAAAPTVPQLMLFDDELANQASSSFDNTTSDSTWIEEAELGGIGTGNHEGEGSVYDSDTGTYRWFDLLYAVNMIKKAGSPTGGMRSLLASGANPSASVLVNSGILTQFVDSLSTANTDTMTVFEKLNLHKAGAARVVFASVGEPIVADSSALKQSYDRAAINWPVLLYALAHLDSLAGGEVLGKKKALQWGAVFIGGGTASDRRHNGGFFLADSNIVRASCDSLGTLNAKIVVAADPESLAARPWQVDIFNRIKSVRYAPWVRHGLDTLELEADGKATLTKPIDAWGRYRNRAIFGDSTNHTVSGSDTSIYANISAARKLLRAQVGNRLSTTLIAGDFDWSPFQMRMTQNTARIDSLKWLVAELGGPLIVNVQNRDRDPAYRTTTPVGWNLDEGRYRSSLSGKGFTVLGHNGITVRGSRVGINDDGLSFLGQAPDSTVPYLTIDAAPNAPCMEAIKFWSGFFDAKRAYSMYGDDAMSAAQNGVWIGTQDVLYGFNKASVIVLPTQTLGGQSETHPNRWGFWTIKHLIHATRAINAKAGRTIIQNAWPEDIEP